MTIFGLNVGDPKKLSGDPPLRRNPCVGKHWEHWNSRGTRIAKSKVILFAHLVSDCIGVWKMRHNFETAAAKIKAPARYFYRSLPKCRLEVYIKTDQTGYRRYFLQYHYTSYWSGQFCRPDSWRTVHLHRSLSGGQCLLCHSDVTQIVISFKWNDFRSAQRNAAK